MGPLGILGGGQLGRMTLQAASRLGIDVVIAELAPEAPASRLTSTTVLFDPARGGWADPQAQAELARQTRTVTLESEFVDARALAQLEGHGVQVWPSPACVGVVQDKFLQKTALARAELPVPRFRRIDRPADLIAAGAELGWPLMLKARRDGYDGRGNRLVRGVDDAETTSRQLGWPDSELLVEEVIPFARELAAMVVRGRDGALLSYPVVESRQDPSLHICREVLAPAPVEAAIAARAAAIARAAVEAVDGVGAFGVELFLLDDGQLLINELAPRPHNSGHYSIDACWSSQFENHVRAVLGLPLGDPGLQAPAAAMVNVLGTHTRPIADADLAHALAVPRAFVHLYGKLQNRPGRKMGHVTALGSSVDEALDRARVAVSALNA